MLSKKFIGIICAVIMTVFILKTCTDTETTFFKKNQSVLKENIKDISETIQSGMHKNEH